MYFPSSVYLDLERSYDFECYIDVVALLTIVTPKITNNSWCIHSPHMSVCPFGNTSHCLTDRHYKMSSYIPTDGFVPWRSQWGRSWHNVARSWLPSNIFFSSNLHKQSGRMQTTLLRCDGKISIRAILLSLWRFLRQFLLLRLLLLSIVLRWFVASQSSGIQRRLPRRLQQSLSRQISTLGETFQDHEVTTSRHYLEGHSLKDKTWVTVQNWLCKTTFDA